MHLMRLFAAVFLTLMLAFQATADSATRRLNAFFSNVHALEGEFEQTLFDENRRKLEESRGTMYLARPGHFRWDYSEPYQQIIVANGNRVWIYDSELAQVTVRTLDDSAGNTPALLLSSDRPLEDNFNVTNLGEEGGLDWVELMPKAQETNFSSVRLGFGPSDLEVMELNDNFGQTTQLRFFGVTTNPELDPSLFSFSPPDGVDVIGE